MSSAKLRRCSNVVLLRPVRNISSDTVEALETMLELARAGEITGLAYGCVLPGGQYFTNVAGSCFTRPTFALGMIGVLTNEIASLIRRRDPSEAR